MLSINQGIACVLALFVGIIWASTTPCEGPDCENNYIHKDFTNYKDYKYKEILDEIEALKYENPKKAYFKLEDEVLTHYPASPRGLNIKMRILKMLYDTLDGESKVVGRQELLRKSMKIGTYLLKMNPSEIPEKLLLSVAEFLVNMCTELKEAEWLTFALEEIVYGSNKGVYPTKTREKYALMLVEQLTIGANFERSVKERAKDPISYRANIEEAFQIQTKSKLFDSMIIDYLLELELQMYKRGQVDTVKMLDELCADIGYFLSIEQKAPLHVSGLVATKFWEKDMFDTKADWDNLEKVREKWQDIRNQVVTVLDKTPDTEFNHTHPGHNQKGLEKQLIIHSPGFPSKAQEVCSQMIEVCMMLQEIPRVIESVLGSVYITILEPGAAVLPHVAKTNFNLRVALPLVAPEFDKSTMGRELPEAGMAVGDNTLVVFEQGKLAIYDPSFSHQYWNRGSEPVIMLVFDMEHPDIGQKTRSLLQLNFESLSISNDDNLNTTDAFVLVKGEPDKNVMVDFDQKNKTANGTEEAETKKKAGEPTTMTVSFGGPSDEPQNVQMITKLVESPDDMEAFKKQEEGVEGEEDEEVKEAKKKGYRIIEVDDDSLIDIYPKNYKLD